MNKFWKRRKPKTLEEAIEEVVRKRLNLDPEDEVVVKEVRPVKPEIVEAAESVISDVRSKNINQAVKRMIEEHSKGCDCGVEMTEAEATELAMCIATKDGPGLDAANKAQEKRRRSINADH